MRTRNSRSPEIWAWGFDSLPLRRIVTVQQSSNRHMAFSEVLENMEKEDETEIRVFWSPYEKGWIAESEDGVDAFAETKSQALKELANVMEICADIN